MGELVTGRQPVRLWWRLASTRLMSSPRSDLAAVTTAADLAGGLTAAAFFAVSMVRLACTGNTQGITGEVSLHRGNIRH